MSRTMPKQKPHKSEQTVSTPWSLIKAVQYRFGNLRWDLAATSKNTKAPYYITLEEGPDFEECLRQDSLTVDWHNLDGLQFCNPPYSAIGPWARKAYEESLKGAKVLLLTPLGCQKWYCDWILGKAYELKLRERVTFEGHTAPYPKDLCLYWFNCGIRGSEVWSWNTTLKKHEAHTQ